MDNIVIQGDMAVLKAKLLGSDGWQLVKDIRATLESLQKVQTVVSAIVPGCITSEEPTPEQIRTYGLALIVEVSEFINEFSWKPWKPAGTVDKVAIAHEFADILAFIGILVHYMDMLEISPEDLAIAYKIKSVININRFLGQEDPRYDQREAK